MTDTPQSGSGPGAPIGEVPLPPGYELVGRLGSGGFATVWLAEQARLGRRVAVKLLGESLSDAERERRFVAECRAIGRLSGHPSVVTVHDAGTTDAGRPYLVMEHLPGGSLQDRLRGSGPLPWPEAVEAAVCVGDALAAAHEAGILHRDVKPANVLLDAQGHPKLGDFGIARLAEGTQTATGTVVGTLTFTPPEVLSGERPGPAADIWALGATLHALLAGRSPYAAESDEAPAAVIARVLRGDASPLPPSVPADVRALVAQCLRTDPADRPPDAAAVVRRLHAIQQASSLPPTPTRAVRPPTPAPTPPPPAPEPPPPRPSASPPPPPPPPAPRPATPPPPPGTPDPDGATDLGPPPGTGAATPPPADPGTVVAPPPPPTSPPPPGAPAPAGRRSRAPLLVAGAVAALAALVVAVLVLWPDDDGDAGGADPTPPSTTEAPPPPTGIDGLPLALLAAPTGPPEPRWEVPFPCGEGCRGAGSEALAVLASATGEVVALDPAAADGTSAVAWQATIEGAAGVPWVRLAGDLAVVEVPISEATHRFVALDATSGGVRWELELPGLANGGLVGDVEADTLVVVGSDPDDETPDGLDRGSTHVVDPATGSLLWSAVGHVVGTTDDAVAVSDGSRVALHDRRSGTERWAAEVATGPLVASQALPRGVLVEDRLVVTSEGEAVGLDVDDGRQWRTPLPPGTAPDPSTGVVAAADADGRAVVLVGGPDGVVALDPGDGAVLWDVADGDPVAGDGSLLVWVGTPGSVVVGRADGTLTARDLADGAATATASVPEVEQWLLLDGQVVARVGGAVVAHDTATLDGAWRVDGRAEALVAAPRGYLAATGDAVVRHEGAG